MSVPRRHNISRTQLVINNVRYSNGTVFDTCKAPCLCPDLEAIEGALELFSSQLGTRENGGAVE